MTEASLSLAVSQDDDDSVLQAGLPGFILYTFPTLIYEPYGERHPERYTQSVNRK